jgi:hypothetical protein
MGNHEAYHDTYEAAENDLQGYVLQLVFQLDNDIAEGETAYSANSAPEGAPCNLFQDKVTCCCCDDDQNNLNDNVQEVYSL